MDWILLGKALILGVVEGLTKFLPIEHRPSDFGGDLLDFNDEKGRSSIVIQCGAIPAVCWGTGQLLSVLKNLPGSRSAQRFAMNLLVAFPVAVLGLLFGKSIKAVLFKPAPVAIAFIVGGLIILWAERRKHKITVEAVDDMTWRHALMIGMAQCLALIPGTSRAGSTIIGGLFFGLSRRAATEFSFFLAVPVLFAASGYELFKNRALFSSGDVGIFGVGFVAAFVSAFFSVRWLLRYISRHDFTAFAWYRIAFGIVVLVTAYTGLVNWTAS
jgi:undecaprenyl-diphosphatase